MLEGYCVIDENWSYAILDVKAKKCMLFIVQDKDCIQC